MSNSTARIITFFSFKQIRKGALIIGLVFALAAVSQTIGLAKAYPTAAERGALINSLKENIGLRVMFGSSEHLTNSVNSYANWRVIGLITVIGAIWGIAITTRLLRGEEENGRWELLTTGPITARRATLLTLLGVGLGVSSATILAGTGLAIAGRDPSVAISIWPASFYGITMTLGACLGVSIAAVTSQLAGTRQQATRIAVASIGAAFLARAASNTVADFHWLRRINPLSWVDNLLPLTDRQYIWLIPLTVFMVVLISLALFLAGKRDLGASFIKEKDSAKAHTTLLKSPLGLSLRLSRSSITSWMVGITVPCVIFGILAVTATKALEASNGFADTIHKVVGGPATTSVTIFLGMGFLIIGIALMALAASAVQLIRNEESTQTLDALLVRPVARLRWLGGRLGISLVWIVIAALWAGTACWLVASRQSDIAYGDMLAAGANMIAPALFILGLGVAVFGFWPRATSAATYGIIGWSFLLEILGSLLDLPKWLLGTSLLHHIAAAPAVAPHWGSALIMGIIGICLTAVGAAAFSRRDLENS